MNDSSKKHIKIAPTEIVSRSRKAGNIARVALLGLFHAIRDGWHGFFERRVPMMAAALAFYFMLGLIPFLFIMAATSGYFLKNNPGISDQVSSPSQSGSGPRQRNR